MKTLTFTVSKGGVGKSLLTANVGAALANAGKKVIMIEGDPNRPLQLILNVDLGKGSILFDEVVKRDSEAEKAVYRTSIDNLFIVPSAISLQGYFDVDPIRFARKIQELKADFLLIDTPFPLGNAAFLSLGVCEYFIPVLTEDEFVLCVESAIDTIRLGKYYLKCVPLGFVMNRIKTWEKFNEEFIRDLEDLLELQCLAKIGDDLKVSKSYGGPRSEKAFLAYKMLRGSEFAKEIDKIAAYLNGELPAADKTGIPAHLEALIKR